MDKSSNGKQPIQHHASGVAPPPSRAAEGPGAAGYELYDPRREPPPCDPAGGDIGGARPAWVPGNIAAPAPARNHGVIARRSWPFFAGQK